MVWINNGDTGLSVRTKLNTIPNDGTSFTGVSPILITETVTSSSAANVTFSGIAATYRDLEIRVRGRGDTAATSTTVLMQFNTDTGNNYDWQQENRFGAGGFANATSSIEVSGDLSAATATASYPTGVIINVFDYRGTAFFKAVDAASWHLQTQANAGMWQDRNAGWWRSTSAITSVKLFLGAGNFVDGSVVSLYGRY